VGLVAFQMSVTDIKNISMSLVAADPAYKVVVDNSPSDDSKLPFKELGWSYIHNPSNPGFGSSHNLIFELYSNQAEYHLIVNPDVLFTKEVIEELVAFLNNNQQAGCVMPKIYYPNGSIQRLAKLLPFPTDLIARRLPVEFIRNRVNHRLELHSANYNSGIFKVPFVSGCFLLFRSRVIEKVGFFDERFFMYFEDTDLSRRLWVHAAWPYYFGKTSVVHRYEKGSSKSLRLFIIHVASAFRYFNKWGWIDSDRRKINRDCLDQF